VLVRVWSSDAFAAAALDAELSRSEDLDARDARLATEFVYGVLRTQGALEARLSALTSKGKLTIDSPAVRAHLLIGAYAICFLDRIPAFAAVSEAVGAIRAEGDPRTGSFANAVLRKLATEVDEKGRPSVMEMASASAPGWLRGALRRSLGRSGAEAYLSTGPVPPPIGLSLLMGEDRAAWLERLRAAAPEGTFEPGNASPRAILVRGAGDVRRLPGAGDAWIVQEEGAQVVALALGAKRGERVLDACAGRGNKTWLLAQEVGPEGAVDAADLFESKLVKLREGAAGRGVRRTYAVDWSQGAGEVPGAYDRVLVDAPCSGVGTLRRRPEIALRRTPEDVKRLSELQITITRSAATRVKDGGRLVLAVCSVLREEAEEAVERLVKEPSGGVALEAAEIDVDALQGIVGAGATQFRLLPHVNGTDGYFVAGFVVRRAG
jgi:16S rRNA (cytosine967-C5)-methyltransferase